MPWVAMLLVANFGLLFLGLVCLGLWCLWLICFGQVLKTQRSCSLVRKHSFCEGFCQASTTALAIHFVLIECFWNAAELMQLQKCNACATCQSRTAPGYTLIVSIWWLKGVWRLLIRITVNQKYQTNVVGYSVKCICRRSDSESSDTVHLHYYGLHHVKNTVLKHCSEAFILS